MKRRALVSAPWVPEFDRNRGAQRVDAMVRFLRDDGWSVTLLAERRIGDDWHAERLRELGVPTFAGYEQAQDVVTHGRFDLAVVAFWQPAERLIPIIRLESPETRVLLDTHDLWFLREARRHFGVEGQLDPGYGAAMARELNTYQQADALLTVSVREAEWLNDLLGPNRAEYLPMEEPTDCSTVSFDDRRGMVFVGNFRHLPNGDAVEYLCRDVVSLLAPKLLTEHPLSVVGNHLDDKVRAYSKNMTNVDMIGWVPSVVPYLERARACVVPLLYGAGVKGKVLQALMLGTPVVTTPIGAEGLDLVDDVHALIADTPTSLANGITRLLTEPQTWKRISQAGRVHVVARHDENAVRARFLSAVENVLARPASDAVLPEAFRHSRRRYEAYRRTITAVREVVSTVTEPGTILLVVSKGDHELVAVDGRTARHFPEAEDGRWAGYHPADSESAIAHLEEQRSRGGRYLVLPDSAFWWLHHYGELATYLETTCLRLHGDEHLIIYDLCRRPSDQDREDHAGASEASGVLVVGTYGPERREPPHDRVAALEASRRYAIAQRWHPGDDGTCVNDRDVVGSTEPGVDWTLFVGESAVIRPGFVDDFLALADRLGAERAQAPHTNGPAGGPPVTERLRGCVARWIPGPTRLPVTAVRSGASVEGTTLITDAVPIELSRRIGDEGRSIEEPSVDDVVVHGQATPVRAVVRSDSDHAPLVSVVIATYDRPELLTVCLEGFCAQTLDSHLYEIIVVDDGSRGEQTRAVLDAFEGRLRICRARIDHAGRASAKNLGVLLAQGELVLFFDDDDRPDPGLLEEHLSGHRMHPGEAVAILGHTDWAPEVDVTPLMHFLTEVDQLLFSYGNLSEGISLGWRCFWEGRISCKRSLLLRHGLHDQRLDYSIDIELGWRLARHGLEVWYWPSARSYMVRPVDLEDFCARTEAKARAQVTMASIHPNEEIQRYARVIDAHERWRSASPTLGHTIRRARALEAQVTRARQPEDPRLDDLHRCYRAIIDAYSAKGVCEALGSDGKMAPLRSTQAPAHAGRDGNGKGERNPELTVTIPVWSRTAELADMAVRTMERVWSVSRVPTEVVVVDNGSPHQRSFRARVRQFAENRGVSAAWNEGISLARAPVVAVLNSDCTVEPGWDEALCEAATTGRRIAFPYTDHGDGRGFRQPDQGGTSGWCFALTTRLFQEIGRFDERFSPAFCEDTDYWHRAWEAGVELSPVPAAHVTHVRRATTGLDAHVDWLLQGHRYKYGWKHGVDPHRAPPYYNRTIVEYHCRGRASLVGSG